MKWQDLLRKTHKPLKTKWKIKSKKPEFGPVFYRPEKPTIQPSRKKCRNALKTTPTFSIGFALFLMTMICFSPSCLVEAAEIGPEKAVTCILGEAAGEGLTGMLAVAEAMRNRGTIQGVHGCKRKAFAMAQSEKLKNLAVYAWEQSKHTDLTKGADHWENVNAFGVPSWAHSMKRTAVIGQHTFWRSK